ncbi:hypothetical protein ACFWFZ_02280 [Streptomyces sp. NPDC060232]|uniref:hypothetical protein n=1 Tax=Streptomyces sp. NPDC060232 TaxID=3347079 RepID=UPI003653A922
MTDPLGAVPPVRRTGDEPLHPHGTAHGNRARLLGPGVLGPRGQHPPARSPGGDPVAGAADPVRLRRSDGYVFCLLEHLDKPAGSAGPLQWAFHVLPTRVLDEHKGGGTTAAVALALSAFMLTIASLLTANWPLCALAGAVAIVFHAKIAASARACRECALLPATA